MGEPANLSIKNWAVEDRPREKLLSKGINSLSNAELLAILIRSGSQNESAVELGKKILRDADNNLQELGKINIETFQQKYHGIGEAKAISIVAALELGRRRKNTNSLTRPKITCSKDAFDLLHPILSDLPHEEFWILLLKRSNKVINHFKISQGGISGTVIDPRLIMKPALEQLASSIILSHNHPSGNTLPSEADNNVTKKIQNAGKIMDIPIIDHIIIGDNSYFSYADEGLL